MKILVVCQHYYPENFQVTPICEQLVANGHDVTVLTGLPNYPEGIVPDEYKKGHRKETVNGVHVIRCYLIGRKKGPVHLAINYISFYLSAMAKINEIPDDFDLVFSYQLCPILMSIPAKKYAKRHGVPLFLYCCDLWPEAMKAYIKSEKNPLYRYIGWISKRVYDSCDRIAVQSDSFIPYFQKVHSTPFEKLIYVPAFADDKYLDMDLTAEDNGIVDFVFLGNLGIQQNLVSVLAAVKQIKDLPSFAVHFVGTGSQKEEMEGYAADNDLLDIVVFHGRHPVEEMPKFYKLADACLLSLKADSQVGYTMPAKTQGYMAAGKPIIGMIDGSARQVIEEANCGVCVPADDIDGLANVMRDFISHPEKYNDCGENGRRYFRENFRKSIFMERLENEMEQLCEG